MINGAVSNLAKYHVKNEANRVPKYMKSDEFVAVNTETIAANTAHVDGFVDVDWVEDEDDVAGGMM